MNKFLGDNVYYTKLNNNLSVFYVEKKGFLKKYAAISTNYGSNDLFYKEEKGNVVELNHGIAHFLEHKMFEQPDGSDAFSKFSEYGAMANAFTNFHMTSYLFSTTGEFYPSLEHLLSYISQPYFTDENVKKEQGIIAQEIKMYEDNADWRLFFNTLRAMYINHPNSIDIAGTVDSINKITKEELYKCYETFYSASNMVLTIVGDLDWQKILKVVNEADLKDYLSGGVVDRVFVSEPNSIAEKKIIEEMSVSIPMFSLGYKDRNDVLTVEETLKRSVATDMILKLLFGKGSFLDEYLRDNHLIFTHLSYGFTSRNDYGYAIIEGESRNFEEVIQLIKKEIEKVKNEGIKEKDFDRVKNDSLGRIIRMSDSIESLSNLFAVAYFENTSPTQIHDTIKNITLDDINKRLDNFFDEDMCVLSIIKPIGE